MLRTIFVPFLAVPFPPMKGKNLKIIIEYVINMKKGIELSLEIVVCAPAALYLVTTRA